VYVKVFSRILESSLWDEPTPTRCAWFALMLLADQDGIVYGTPSALARAANLTLDEMQAALDLFQKPDPNSTSPDDDGRRIALVAPNHWLLTNYKKYREAHDTDVLRAQSRARSALYRSRKAAEAKETRDASRSVTANHDKQKQKQKQIQKELDPPSCPPLGDAGADPPKKGARVQKVQCRVQIRRDASTGDCAIEGVTDADRTEWRAKYGLTDDELTRRLDELRDYAASLPSWYQKRAAGGNWLATIRNWLAKAPIQAPSRFPDARRMTAYEKVLANLPDYGEG